MKKYKFKVHEMYFRKVFTGSRNWHIGWAAFGTFNLSTPPVQQRKRLLKNMWKKTFIRYRRWGTGEE